MNIKTTFLLVLFAASLTISFAQEPVTIAYKLPKDKKLKYTLAMTSRYVNLVQEAEFTGTKTSGDSLTVNALITKAEFDDPDMNYGNGSYVDQPFYFVMDGSGKVLQPLTYTEDDSDAAKQFNQKLFFPDLPATSVNTGAKWSTEGEAFDMVFDYIVTSYTLKSVSATEATIHCEQTLTGMDGMAKKKHTGDYILDLETGAVLSAELEISGTNGFSAITGHISIKQTAVE
jgi:hypothetical protein